MQDKIIEFLKERYSVEEIPLKSQKHRCCISPRKTLFWIGERGTVRVGETLPGSRNITSYIHERMARKG